jgi:hypothetical protein
LLAATTVEPAGPRELYYRAMAHQRLGHDAEARAALAALRAAHPGHLLVTATESLFPAEDAPVPAGEINDSATTDDGSNVLR